MPPWRVRTIETGEHPLRIESEEYHLTWVHDVKISLEMLSRKKYDGYVYGSGNTEFDEHEQEMIMTHARDIPAIAWAVDNSFDGLYVKKKENYEAFVMVYRFGVYLKEHHATFWKLKFG